MFNTWGSMERETVQGSGHFHCVRCDSEQKYRLIRMSTYLTLYFIPLFETEHHGDYVQCRHCGDSFDSAVLKQASVTPAQQMIKSIRTKLEAGASIEEIRTQCIKTGVDPAEAQSLVAAAAGEKRLRCNGCDLTFLHGIPYCSQCGARLEWAPPRSDDRVQSNPPGKS